MKQNKRLPWTILVNSSQCRLFFLMGHTHVLSLPPCHSLACQRVEKWKRSGRDTMYLCCIHHSRLALPPTPRAVVDLADDPLHPLLKPLARLDRRRLDEPRAVPDGVEVQPLRDLQQRKKDARMCAVDPRVKSSRVGSGGKKH